MIRASIVGGSGYTGGELLRLLLRHSDVEVGQVTSRKHANTFVESVHPNLRGRTELRFSDPDSIQECDLLFLCMPHGESASRIDHFAARAERIIDLSSDFRLRDPDHYERWYGRPHPSPAWLDRFVYGLPETRRESLRSARYVSGVGCNATAINLALLPLARADLIERVVVEVKVGSSEGGDRPGPASHHPVRHGAVRSFAPVGHRHQGEVEQELGDFPLHVSATAIEMVRGVLATAHVFPRRPIDEREAWSIFRQAWRDEPFVRLIEAQRGLYRYPEPKILSGTNDCDVAFEIDARDGSQGRIVVMSAIDNLVKGAAGSAVQAMNLMLGLDERTALDLTGLHPI